MPADAKSVVNDDCQLLLIGARDEGLEEAYLTEMRHRMVEEETVVIVHSQRGNRDHPKVHEPKIGNGHAVRQDLLLERDDEQ